MEGVAQSLSTSLGGGDDDSNSVIRTKERYEKIGTSASSRTFLQLSSMKTY